MNINMTKKQVVIVIGASSGVGLGITQALLQHGYMSSNIEFMLSLPEE
jgi:NADP-dependent 3-hydroxy acid dehydrogenase YdfG